MKKQSWQGKNSEGDLVTIVVKDNDFMVSYINSKEGYAGATVVPKEALEQLLGDHQ